MKILVSGSSGLIGSALVGSLEAGGQVPMRLVRGNRTADSPSWDPEKGLVDLAGSEDIDAVVHLAGNNIAAGRWSDKRKTRILGSRIQGTRLLSEFFAAANHKPQVIVTASAVGFYGDRGDEILDETAASGKGFLAHVARQWEGAAAPAVEAGIRVVNARFGLVLSPTGGVLKKMRLPFRLGMGGVIGGGRQYISWVSINDVLAMIQHAIADSTLRGPVNCVSPNPITNREFTKTLGRIMHRPTMLPIPRFAVRLALGEMADELLLFSTRVVPKKLMESGYGFCHHEIEDALKDLL